MKKKIYLIIFLFAMTALLSALSGGSDVKATFAGGLKRKLPVYAVDRSDKKVAITFDCAWGAEYTEKIIDSVNRYNAKATFFAVQFWTEKYPEMIRKLDENGIEIGTHSKTHPHMKSLSLSQIKEELLSSKRAIEAITGKEVTLFRAPFGEYSDDVLETAESLSLKTIQWDVDSLDWKDLSADDLATRVIKRVKSGSIILCHNNGMHTAEALPLIFSALQAQGYEFVTVSELLLDGETYIDSQGVQRVINNER